MMVNKALAKAREAIKQRKAKIEAKRLAIAEIYKSISGNDIEANLSIPEMLAVLDDVIQERLTKHQADIYKSLEAKEAVHLNELLDPTPKPTFGTRQFKLN